MAEALAARQRHYIKTLYAKIVVHIYNNSEITDYGDSDIDEIYNNLYQFLYDNEKAVISYGFTEPEARLFHSKDVARRPRCCCQKSAMAFFQF